MHPSRKAGSPAAGPSDQELRHVSLFAASIPYEFYGSTDPGRARDNNEDSIAFDDRNALAVLADGMGGYNAGEIASGMDVHQSTASNLVRLLLEAGFIESLRSGEDRRKVELSITAKGRLLLRKAPKPYTGVLPHALAALSANQLKALRTSLEVVRTQLNVEPALAKKPLATM